MSKPNWIGQTLGGRYRLEALLGQGGMSAVYRATDPNLRRTVAIKLIHSHLASDPEFVRRFEEEAAAVARLRHPNIVQVYDFNHDDDVYYMVLEYVPGETLQEKLRILNNQQKLLPFTQTITTGINLCEAVQYAHHQGMIHRDLKPANVMITPKEEAILMDFGIAKMVGGENLTATGAMIGTVSYMAPEQIRGQRPDHRVDIYALGVMLFEMVSGRRPFEGDSAPSTMMMHLTEPVPDLRQINQNTPPQLAQIIEKSLAKEPDQRYQNAGELAAALRSVSLQAAASTVNTAAMTAVQSPAIPVVAPPLPTSSQLAGVSSTASQSMAPTGTGPQSPATAPRSARPLIFAGLSLGVVGLLIILCGVAVVSGQFFGSGGNRAAEQTAEAEQAAIAAETSAASAQATIEAEQAGAQETSTAATAQAEQELATTAATLTAQANTQATVEMATMVAQQSAATATAHAVHLATQYAELEATSEAQTAIAVQQPTASHSPTSVANPTATPTQVAAGPSVRITNITLSGDRYHVFYETTGYAPNLPGMHVHFFFNTVSQANAGIPGSGPWELYAGPVPFTVYGPAHRPAGATQMCALVANPDHSVILNTGNCMDLP